ncbi:electroneutral sodium bicarbonate exchanger 1 isoform X3 [Phoca vitulina]|uniref:electroneutral sodium bicarbonate exchanger 1 isoform X3 n=1 Tax=Phoca vitulina TaxID=9720 RepID=UPI001395E83D|nr:electroneutral sodium bicarbonate exchanger 1 isoform X3 [Phoca vitulina]
MPAGSNEPDGVLSYQRPDEEAVVDQGGTSTILNIHYEKEELEGHRTLYVGVRMPLGRQSHRHHRTHGQKHRRRGRGKGASQGDEGPEALAHDTPSQRVQFILGTEEDEEHVPHELFTELDEICMKEGEDAEWKETARWLKFEEDVEDGGERWSKPYVATLSLHSLFELRSCLINGTVLLDMRANSIEEISDLILDQQELFSDLNDSMRVKVREALLKKHHHQNEKKRNNLIPIVRSFAEVGKKQSDPHSMDKNGQTVSPQSVPTTSLEVKNGVNCEHSPVDLSKVDLHFMKKIPTGAEASNVLVGEVDTLDRPIVAFVRLSPAVLLSGLTEVPIPTRFLFILLGPVGKGQQYHEIGRSMATIMTDEIFHDVAYKAKERDDLLAGIDEFLDQVTVLPPGEWDPTIRIEPPKNVPSQEKRKMPGVPNGNVCHIEPEPHGGHSGPELQRTGRDYALSYLSLRACIGLWTAFLCIVLVATDASSLVCYITRFTEEAFASLICIIFIYEAIEKLIHLAETYPIHMHSQLDHLSLYYCRCTPPENPNNHTLQYWKDHNIVTTEVHWANLTVSECQEMHGEFTGSACGHHGPYTPDVLFWSCILFFTTFILSSTLKTFKTSRYFPTRVRSMVSDFAVFLTIFTMVIIDFLIGVPSPKLQVPSVFKPTRDDRGWIISPIGPNPWWTVIAAIIPALLCTILIFMDQQITAVIINRKEHKLKKGCGYHLDLLMVAIMLGVCSIMGLPWFVAATVLSITHVNSLKLESECSAPGEQPKFLGIREQRVTGLMIFVLMGCSVFMTAILKFIPMPVLYGVFLYMGVSSLQGIQFFDRLKLFGMPAKHQPDFIYLRHVPLRKVHLFTLIQLTCLVLLWVIKASPAAIVFPMMVLALVFVRKVMDLCFSKRELSWLDDLMPESKKKKLDDAKKKAKEEEEAEKMLEMGGDKFPLESRKLLSSPGKNNSFRCDPSEINISDEMPKTTVWKALSMNSGNTKEKRTATREDPASHLPDIFSETLCWRAEPYGSILPPRIPSVSSLFLKDGVGE